jgi:CRISPR-associated protein Csm2
MSEYAKRHDAREYTPAIPLNLKQISFATRSPDLFDRIADETAECIAQNKKSNKSTQLRKYYDELCMWEQKIKQIDKQLKDEKGKDEKDKVDKYKEYLPLIKMLNAKVAYAYGRNELVDKNFVDLMRHCLGQLTEDKKTFETCKLFFEAFMGFYKVHENQRSH